ncbi:MAG: hypothetical protein GXY65_11090 [Rhodococcus sp.]|uniref:hypothetical protein n=1 Tax=unclassified Rhodococcus (in: high G+C Gram-positive bacteria) TaxID=192944 RepID=UPI00146E9805|nr:MULTISPECIES: hypothetical protein [unclassified Rhodococcus (in: high G+C Gram-positive bacteria)]MCK0091372.1 hypothetical protein [Rhodococcus sp. F64268]NLU63760.1 hypothetical protein [Rhodococcus sp. HNM0563]NLV79864.1 hypothetical protein [Rhodococcus sp. (in: high G+C Gram-positive bacteria)]
MTSNLPPDLLAKAHAEADEMYAREQEAGYVPPEAPDANPTPRTKVLQIRLAQAEYTVLAQLADARGLAPSTLARGILLERIEPKADQAEAVAFLRRLADTLEVDAVAHGQSV